MWKFDDLRRVGVATVVALVAMLAAVGGAEALRPHRVMADELPALNLQEVVPRQFGDWVEAVDAAPVVSDPTLDATLAQFYSQTLSRTYVNSKGQRVMLSLAYGRNQNSWNSAAHRPEFCYDAQGFSVSALQMAQMFATIANDGVRIRPTVIAGTVDSTGHFTGAQPQPQVRVVSASTASRSN